MTSSRDAATLEPMEPHALDAAALCAQFDTSLDVGLTEEEVARRQTVQGPNRLPAPPRERTLTRLLRQLLAPMSILLIAAALVSWPILGERLDGIVILAIVVVNAVIGTAQEGRAAGALDALRSLETPSARVVRNDRTITVPAAELVTGDLVRLEAGDRVPADLRLVDASSLEVDESILTGESLPVVKTIAPLDPTTPTADRLNMVHAGTHVLRGACTGIVTAIGSDTQMGRIAADLHDDPPPTPLQKELASVTRRLGVGAVSIAVGLFTFIAFGSGGGIESAFLVAVALAVAAVPEGLPTVVTIGLALGVGRMAKRGAIVRHLPAVETLGSTTVLLTDKTGTLTENRMAVDRIADVDGREPSDRLIRALWLCNDATSDPPTGDPVDLAILEALEQSGERPEGWIRVGGTPFDSDRRRMEIVASDGSTVVRAVKGAMEALMPLCTSFLDGHEVRPLDEDARRSIADIEAAWAARGARVLAVADCEVPEGSSVDESDLTLLGLIGLADPVRPDAGDAVAQAGRAGVTIIMVTGDHPGTAAAVAESVGIPAATTRTGADIADDGIPDDPKEATRVYARVDPAQKLALAARLQELGHVVAVTGDGVNDAPALRRADIGVAMGKRGSDVAREASGLVLVDDDLSTIVAAIREGRGVYDNLRKVVEYLIGGNLSEIIVVVATLMIVGDFAAGVTAIQLLWINLLTDGLPALALGVDPVDPHVMDRAPRPRNERLLDASVFGRLALRASVLAAAPLTAAMISVASGDAWSVSRSVLFTTLVVVHLLYALALRSSGRSPQPLVWGAAILGIGLHLLLFSTPTLAAAFDLAPIPSRHWAVIAATAAASGVVVDRMVHRR